MKLAIDNKGGMVALSVALIILVILLWLDRSYPTPWSEEGFIPINPQCGHLHGPIWTDNSCWMDTSLIALFGPESTRMYFYQYLQDNNQDSSELATIKGELREMVDSMWISLEDTTKENLDVLEGGGTFTKKDSQEFRNKLKQLYQGSFHQNYREISGFVESGDLNYSHRFLSDLCYILGIPGLPLDNNLTHNSVTYLLPPPEYSGSKKNTHWSAFGKINDWDNFKLQRPHPFIWYRCSFRQLTGIPNIRTVQTYQNGEQHYEISAIIILAFQHYVTYFRCGGSWYLYDGLMEEDPVIQMKFDEFTSNLSSDKLYHASLSTSIFSRLDNTNKKIFDPRHAWLAPNNIDYEGDALCMYSLVKKSTT